MEVPKTFQARLADGQAALTVSQLVSSIHPEAWRRLAFGLGEKGLNFYDWAALRVTPTTDEVGEQGLLIRRKVNDSDDPTLYVSNAPLATRLQTLAAGSAGASRAGGRRRALLAFLVSAHPPLDGCPYRVNPPSP